MSVDVDYICNLPFLLCFTLYLRTNSKYKPLGAYIRRSDLTEGFLRYEFGPGLIFGILQYFPEITQSLVLI